MATSMDILSYGMIFTLTAILTGFLSIPIKGNAIDPRVLQRELGESTSEIMSMNDKDDYREPDESPANGYYIKSKNDDQNLENVMIDYLFAKQIMNKLRSRTDSLRTQKKRNYWKQCAFNAVSCFG